MSKMRFTRRDFLKLAALGVGSLAMRPLLRWHPLPDWPEGVLLGRNATDGRIALKAEPFENSATLDTLYEDTVVPWKRILAVPDSRPNYVNQTWVDTGEGYIYAPYLQPVMYRPNQPMTELPNGKGFWAEVTVPYVDLVLANPPARSPWARDLISFGLTPRLYYQQVVWIDAIKEEDGVIWYRFNEDEKHGYGFGDIFWADGRAFRPLTPEDVAPIHPDVPPQEKRVVVDLRHQTLSCYEGSQEVYFCRISSGAKFDAYGNPVDKWSTPEGEHITWRKAISIHMVGGTTGAGYDTPAIPWTVLFSGTGIAIHGAFWHNDFGTPRSHGCVNVTPEDARWIFRWTTPVVTLDNPDVQSTWTDGDSTHVIVTS
jgi:hypothetical protein